jgi:hypothetical protein
VRFNLLETSVCVCLFSIPMFLVCYIKCSIREFYVVLILVGLSTKYGRQSTEGYIHDGRLIGRDASNHKPDGNRNTRHKIYTGSCR